MSVSSTYSVHRHETNFEDRYFFLQKLPFGFCFFAISFCYSALWSVEEQYMVMGNDFANLSMSHSDRQID